MVSPSYIISQNLLLVVYCSEIFLLFTRSIGQILIQCSIRKGIKSMPADTKKLAILNLNSLIFPRREFRGPQPFRNSRSYLTAQHAATTKNQGINNTISDGIPSSKIILDWKLLYNLYKTTMLTCVIAADKSLMVISKLSQTRLIEHPASVGHKMLTLPSLYNLEIITYVCSCSDYFEIFIDSHNSNTGQNNLFSYLLHTTSAFARSPYIWA